MVQMESFVWNLLQSSAKETIQTLYLGHDGLIEQDDESMKKLIAGLPQLTEIYYADYDIQ